MAVFRAAALSMARRTLGRATARRFEREVEDALRTYPGPHLSLEESQRAITEAAAGTVPHLLARPGGNELDVVRHFIAHRLVQTLPSRRHPYPEPAVKDVADVAGVVPRDETTLDGFAATYLSALLEADLLVAASWTRWCALLPGMSGVPTTDLLNLDPFATLKAGCTPWTLGLAGRRVLVVNPFVESISHQFARRSVVTGVSEVLPEFELLTLRPPVTHGGNPDGISWREGLDRTLRQMSRLEFDVALVGAGAYGLPIAAHAKSMGRIGLNLGGVTQILFGVAGERWRRGTSTQGFMDETWVSPNESERPPRPDLVEGGAYW